MGAGMVRESIFAKVATLQLDNSIEFRETG